MASSMFARSLVRDVTITFDKKLFMQRTVGELTFKGYFEPMMEELGNLKGETLLPNNTFGIYYGVRLQFISQFTFLHNGTCHAVAYLIWYSF